jgi:lysophospholipase L1-like esterase
MEEESEMKFSKLSACCLSALVLAISAGASRGEILVKEGESIAFMGDSITAQGAGSPGGYVRLVISGLEANGVKATAIPAGVSGHKSNQMLARLQKDVIDKKPTWMTLSCGVNDVWHGERGVPLDEYKKNITAIVDQAQAAGVKVVLLTATMIQEDASNEPNAKLASYNDFLRELAKEKNLPLADLNALMQEGLKQRPEGSKGNYFTNDGVHMGPRGNQMMAEGVLTALGLDEKQLETAREKWLDTPDTVALRGNLKMSQRQFQKLEALAKEKGMTVQQLIDAELAKLLEASKN